MEIEVLKIKCPCCGALLAVKKQPGIENKRVKCPICKESSPFMAFKKAVSSPYEHIVKAGNEERTVYEVPYSRDLHMRSMVIGSLWGMKGANLCFHLHPGKNVVGRKASVSTAEFQIPTEKNSLSREHLVIDVRSVPGKGYVHYLSLYKEKCNETFLNDERLEYGDSVVLRSGDIIKMPEVELRFDIPNDEGTQF